MTPQQGVRYAGQLGNTKLQAPPNFTGSNNLDEWDNFSFKLKMYLSITMPHMVTNMEEAEEAKVFDYDTYQPELQEQARALMALLGSLCVDAAATFVGAQDDAGNRYDGYKLWNSLKNRFTLRQNLTPRLMSDRNDQSGSQRYESSRTGRGRYYPTH